MRARLNGATRWWARSPLDGPGRERVRKTGAGSARPGPRHCRGIGQGDRRAGTLIESGPSMTMAAGGGRDRIAGSDRASRPRSRPTRCGSGTRSEEAQTVGGRLNGTTPTVPRLRTALESAQTLTLRRDG